MVPFATVNEEPILS